MMIETDRRQLKGERDVEAETLIQEGQAEFLELQLRLAKLFARFNERAGFLFHGCASLEEYAVRAGYDGRQATFLLNLGKTLLAAPEFEEGIRAGEIPLSNAATLGRIVSNPAYVRPGDDWARVAQHGSFTQVVRDTRRRVAEVEQRDTSLTEVSVYVHGEVKDDFERARVIASRKERRTLDDGQTFKRVVDHYLDSFDPQRRAPGTRRLGDTNGIADSRYVPAEVQRAIRERSGGRCEFDESCPHRIHLQLVHLHPHAKGSGREAEDLVEGCNRHHTMYDAGCIRFKGWKDGKPVFEPIPVDELPGSDPPAK